MNSLVEYVQGFGISATGSLKPETFSKPSSGSTGVRQPGDGPEKISRQEPEN